MFVHNYGKPFLNLASAVDDFGNEVTLLSWQAIIGRMDFILSGDE